MPAIRPRRCNDCGAEFDVLCFDRRGVYKNLSLPSGADGTQEPTCACGSTDLTKMVSAARPIFTGGEASYSKIYPYYDNSLGMRIHSHKHHEEVKKRLGLVTLDKADIQAGARHLQSEHDRIEKWKAEEDDKMRHHPAYREFREQADKGALTDHLSGKEKEAADKSLKQILQGA